MTRPAGGPRARVPALAGTGLLADDLYLIAHHERDRPAAAGAAGREGLGPRQARCWASWCYPMRSA